MIIIGRHEHNVINPLFMASACVQWNHSGIIVINISKTMLSINPMRILSVSEHAIISPVDGIDLQGFSHIMNAIINDWNMPDEHLIESLKIMMTCYHWTHENNP